MTKKSKSILSGVGAGLAVTILACGGAQKEKGEEAENLDDMYASIVGDVDESEVLEEEEEVPESVNEGPTMLSVHLKVINDRNPKGSFKLINSNDKVVIEKGVLGEPVEVKQGVYAIEFKSPVVFGEPVYLVEDVTVQGEKQTVNETFPAGQLTLHTYKKAPQDKCKAVPFSVNYETEQKKYPNKGKTCEPIILQNGTYELLLDVSKKVIQPVKIQVSTGQVSSASVKLDR